MKKNIDQTIDFSTEMKNSLKPKKYECASVILDKSSFEIVKRNHISSSCMLLIHICTEYHEFLIFAVVLQWFFFFAQNNSIVQINPVDLFE